MKTILAVAGDPGGAAALAPVIEHLHREREVRMNALAYGEAVQLWQAASFAWTPLPAQADERELEDLARDCALLLAGTSGPNGLDYEKRLTHLFRKLRRPSLVVLDYWANYGRRFADENGRLVYVPDRIAAIDEQSRRDLIAAGIPEGRIVITGHPAMDALAAVAHEFSSDEKNAVRNELGVREDEMLVLFAAHPVIPMRSTHEERQTAIDCLVDVLERIATANNKRIALVIRPHPKEACVPYPAQRCLGHTRVYWCGAGDSRRVALAAHAVAGVETMFLVEAYHMGCPTVSIRLNARQDDGPPAIVPAVYDVEALHAFFSHALDVPRGTDTRLRSGIDCASGDAILRVTALISEMLAQGSRDSEAGADR